ncbi:MAG: ABC transporter permease [Planctomycetaceae bacterium]
MSTLIRANAWLENASDWLNPILVKETRQALKSRQFIVTFLLMLIASWLISVFGTLMAGDSLEFGAAGRALFTSYFVVLALAIFVVVPYTAYRGLLNERDQTTLELLNITTLSPRQLVWGKLWSAMVQVFIYYSAIAPFIAFTSMLQGFDVALVAFVLIISILITLCLTMLTLMLAAIPQNRQLQGLITLKVFVGLLGVVISIFGMVPDLLRETILFDDVHFWVGIGGLLVGGMSFFFLFTQIAIAHLTFDADNRSSGVRIACSVQFVLYWSFWVLARLMLGSVVVGSGSDVMFVVAWCILHSAAIGYFSATEPDFVSRRVRRGIPKTTVSRLLFAPFLPGGHRGFLFLLLHLGLIPVILCSFHGNIFAPGREEGWWTVAFMAYVVWYVGMGSALGRLLRRVSAEVRPIHVRVIILIILAVGALLPFLPQLFGSNPNEYEWIYRMLRVLNPFVFLSLLGNSGYGGNVAVSEYLTLIAAAGLGLMLNMRPMWVGIREVLQHPVAPKTTRGSPAAPTFDL